MNEVPVNKRLNAWAAGAARFALAAAVALGAAQAAHAKTSLLVYTALEDEAMKPYKDAFEKANPDIEIRWVRDSTGSVTAKLLAEKNNPRADVVLGLAASSLTLLDLQGMLMPYTPKGFDQLTRKYSDANTPPHWVGMDVWGATICYNRVAAQAKNIPKPTAWEDLTKPVYKGAIVMPSPVSSGTGYLDVTAWLQTFGDDKGWKFMDALDRNVAQYVHSGSKPCTLAGTGEFPIGISFEFRGHELQSQGAPIDLVFPKEGLGWDMEGTAIMKTTKQPDAAKKLADFMASKDANQITARWWAIVAYPGVARKLAGIPDNYSDLLVKNDFVWSAKNRQSILDTWQKRYGAKTQQ
ncbi:putative 2-aminoethylphosphonate ABC transporter substrate-binding protein [Burkholderia cepacia]|uniref:putative 2-aminoethylphosphonate ABC transporter substrate-binding protein n=1 Tax=Burkholderia cepacia TaxID=292 RepID=UPI000757AE63|nr:putative 2-aminoethylphosphonate ABC transporter substrate-binding protein [Burkholderia cepacia]KUY72433.1 phosphonate ABC transporter substrate-binding protein [Burkholderia cepacia]